MRTALYISSIRNEMDSQDENHWHYFEENGQKYGMEKTFPEIEKYYKNITEDALVYLANEHSLVYLSKNKIGNINKPGMIYAYTNQSLATEINVSECIGCTIPRSLSEKLNPPYYGNGKNIEEYLKENPCKLGWFQSAAESQDNHEFTTGIVPIVDKLIALLLKKEKGIPYKKLLLKSEKLGVREHEQLLKRVLISLPLKIASQFSYNTNANAYEALTEMDIACVKNIENSKMLEEMEWIDTDAGTPCFSPVTETGKYMLKKGAIPEKALKCESAKQLEAFIVDTELFELCNEEIANIKIHVIQKLYEVASDKIKEQIEPRLVSAAYRILLSKKYFELNKDEREFLSSFLKDTGEQTNLTQMSLYNAIVEAITSTESGDASQYLVFLFEILGDHKMIDCATEAVKDILYKGKWVKENSKAAQGFLAKLNKKSYESYLCNISAPSDVNDNLIKLILSQTNDKYTSGKERMILYVKIRKQIDCTWLAKPIFASADLKTYPDLEQWKACYKELKGKSEQEMQCLEGCFESAFSQFLKKVGFDRSAREAYKSIENENLNAIQEAAKLFKYNQEGFANKLNEIIKIKNGDEKRADSLRRMLTRRFQLMLGEQYPTEDSRANFARKCGDFNERKKKLLQNRAGADKEKDNRSNASLFFKGVSPIILLPFMCLILATLIMYRKSVDGVGWLIFSSILGVSIEHLQTGFYITVVALYLIEYLFCMLIGSRKNEKEEIIASKALIAAVILILLPCVGISLFMCLIG